MFSVIDHCFHKQFSSIDRVSLVNKALRQIVLDTPTLWTKIRVGRNQSSLHLADLCVERSKTRMLNIEIESDSWFQHGVQIVSTHSHRVQSVLAHIITTFHRDSFHKLSFINMPKLQYLKYYDHRDPRTQSLVGPQDDRLTLTVPDAPQLQDLFLTNCLPIVIPSLSLQALTTMRLRGQFRPPQIEFSKLLSLLPLAPNLCDFWMDGCKVVWSLDETYKPVSCLNLRRLVVKKMPSGFFWQLLGHLELPELAIIHCKPLGGAQGPFTPNSVALDHLSLPSLETFSLELYSRHLNEYRQNPVDRQEISRIAKTVAHKFSTTRQLVLEAEAEQVHVLLGEWSSMIREGQELLPQLEVLTLGRTLGDPADEEIAADFFSQRDGQGFAQVQLRVKDKLTEKEKGLDSK